MIYLLDTNICIALLKGRDRPLVERTLSLDPSDLALSSIVKAELLFGARKSRKVEQNLALLEAFFSQFESLPFDDLAAANPNQLPACGQLAPHVAGEITIIFEAVNAFAIELDVVA